MTDLDELRQFSTPTIANAIESFGIRPRLEGVTNSAIQCLFPKLGVVVGYAVTATIDSSRPGADPRSVKRRDYWEYIRSSVRPSITVIQDLAPKPTGAYWGEINSSLHKALGSLGVITNGTVRDLDEVEIIGFHFFAAGVEVSHGFAHLESFGNQVEVFGMKVATGDLIHADRHGAVVIPASVRARAAAAASQVIANEKPLLLACSLENPINELDRLISPEY